MKVRILGLIVLLSGCAAKVVAPWFVAERAKAEALFKDGCYTCLKESLALYEKMLASSTPPLGADERAFDAALLIAVREKELGIPGDAAMQRARGMAPPSRQALLDAAELIIGDTSGFDPEQRAQLSGRSRPSIEPDNPKRRALDAFADDDLAAKYVGLAIDCEQQKLIEQVDMPALKSTYANTPLLLFRLATCGRPSPPDVGATRAADPRWLDTLYWEGRRELVASMGTAIDFPKALGLYQQGLAAFPDSLSLGMAVPNLDLAAEEFEGAVAGYDAVLAKFPTHRDALNGRMQALSYLLKHDEAIAVATKILELGTWNISDANYWRAWNRYHLKQYDEAWADVENATRGLSNARVYMLAGLIAYARKELPTAVQRFDRAFQLDSTACDAVWMSGLVSIDRNELAVAAPKFTRGMTCFVSSAAALRADAKRVEDAVAKRGTPATAREQRQIERSKRDAVNADEKSAMSAYNAAQCYARTGNKQLALTHVDVAIDYPSMHEKALALKAAIEKLPD